MIRDKMTVKENLEQLFGEGKLAFKTERQISEILKIKPAERKALLRILGELEKGGVKVMMGVGVGSRASMPFPALPSPASPGALNLEPTSGSVAANRSPAAAGGTPPWPTSSRRCSAPTISMADLNRSARLCASWFPPNTRTPAGS